MKRRAIITLQGKLRYKGKGRASEFVIGSKQTELVKFRSILFLNTSTETHSIMFIVSIIYRVLYVFLVSNWHVCSKFMFRVALYLAIFWQFWTRFGAKVRLLYRILHISEASHVEGLIPMWAKHTAGILFFKNKLSRYVDNFVSSESLKDDKSVAIQIVFTFFGWALDQFWKINLGR